MNGPLLPYPMQSGDGRAHEAPAKVILSVSAAREDHAVLRRMLGPMMWEVLEAGSCVAACRLLARRSVTAVVASESLPDGDWRDVLAYALSRPHAPKLIVTSRQATGYLWAEVLNLGGFDLLAKPFEADEVRRVVALTRPPDRATAVRMTPGPPLHAAEPRPAAHVA